MMQFGSKFILITAGLFVCLFFLRFNCAFKSKSPGNLVTQNKESISFTPHASTLCYWTHAMHFALALWQMSSVTIQVPVLISLFRSLEMRVGKAQLGEITLSV